MVAVDLLAAGGERVGLVDQQHGSSLAAGLDLHGRERLVDQVAHLADLPDAAHASGELEQHPLAPGGAA